jgi:hypothetical protein
VLAIADLSGGPGRVFDCGQWQHRWHGPIAAGVLGGTAAPGGDDSKFLRGPQLWDSGGNGGDTGPESHWLQDLIMPFNQASVGWVAGEIQALPGDTLLEKFADRQATLSQKHTLTHHFYPYGQTANLAVRAEVFRSVGLFRPYLTTGGDADLCWRIQQSTTWQWRFAELAVVRHQHRRTVDELRSQWRRYGKSNRYLHELHGIDLMPDRDRQYYGYRMARWALKELPRAVVKLPKGESDLLDCVKTPIELICMSSRSEGQRSVVLQEEARAIEYLMPEAMVE